MDEEVRLFHSLVSTNLAQINARSIRFILTITFSDQLKYVFLVSLY